MVYLGALMLTRAAAPFVTALIKPPKITTLPPIPIDPFNLCEVNIDLQLMLIPNSIGTAFGTYLRSFRLSTRNAKWY